MWIIRVKRITPKQMSMLTLVMVAPWISRCMTMGE